MFNLCAHWCAQNAMQDCNAARGPPCAICQRSARIQYADTVRRRPNSYTTRLGLICHLVCRLYFPITLDARNPTSDPAIRTISHMHPMDSRARIAVMLQNANPCTAKSRQKAFRCSARSHRPTSDRNQVDAVAVAGPIWKVVTEVSTVDRDALAIAKNAHMFPVDFSVAK